MRYESYKKRSHEVLTRLTVSLFLLTGQEARAQVMIDVDVALVLLVDVSTSVDDMEFKLQREGIAAAMNHPEVLQAIQGGSIGRIVVSMVDFSTSARIAVPWTIVEDKKSADAFSSAILKEDRAVRADNTSISQGISTATQMIATSTFRFRATKRVIDVSGDGKNNTEGYLNAEKGMLTAHQEAKDARAVINGLPIEGAEFDIVDYYQKSVINERGFVIVANNIGDFARAIRRKLVLEIS